MTATSNVLDVLKTFCTDLEGKYEMGSPWYQSGHTYATDVKIVCRIAGDHVGSIVEGCRAPAHELVQWKLFETAVFSPMTLEVKPKFVDCKTCKGQGKTFEIECPECDGDGSVSWYGEYSRCEYNDDCAYCNGTGKKKSSSGESKPCEDCSAIGKLPDKNAFTKVPGGTFSDFLLSKISELPNLEIAIHPKGKGFLFFRSGDYHGLVVPLI